MKALIGDSDFASRSVLAAALTALGYEAVTCCTVTEVRDAFSSDFYALVFLNVDETDDAPLAICQWLRSHSSGEIVWIVALTSNAGMIDPAFKAGANDVLLKPINTAAARARILVGSQEIDRLRERREERDAAADRASTRAQQQVAVAALGQWALVKADVEMLIGQAILFVAQFLEVECCGFFALLPESDELLLRDGAGWLDGYVGSARIPADPGSAEGGAIRQEPIIVEDWEKQTRFQMPSLYREHQIRCSLIVLIPGAAAPVGVLAAHATHRREFSEDDIHFLQAVAVVLSLAIERKRSVESIQRLANFPRCNPNPVLELTAQAHLAYANEAAEEMARSFGCNSVVELLPGGYAEIVRNSLASGEGLLRQQVVLARRTLAWSFFPISANQLVHCYAEEITNRLDLESQLRQLQKLECVGQLAAGLAHDFNNVLTIVRGHAELILMDQTLAPKRISSLNKILGAVERASSLTRQLLTFSRRQLVQTKPLDFNDCLTNIVKMLDHVLGENIQLIFEPSHDLPTILGDSGMLDQVVMNLAVNARDAMPKGGRLVLTTSLVEVDSAYAQRHSQAREGRFVCLNVTDTGSGMDAATLSHIFEPFFTTKGVGRGTGLGLATVYSIVKQHQGWVEVSSRVDQGTTFLIFLPCSDSTAPAQSAPNEASAVRGGDETILVVEDEPNLRELARMILQSHGYKVLEAGSGVEALKIWAKQKDRIDLLVTDLIMPEGITGVDLAQRLVSQNASLRTVFVSGYSSDLMGKEGLQDHVSFLQKPYAAQTFARTIREALDGATTNQ